MEERKKCSCVRRCLSASFRVLGRNVAEHPLIYFFVPLLCVAALSLGFLRLREAKGMDYLYLPINGRGNTEKEAVETLFPPTRDGSDLFRETSLNRVSFILIEPTDNGSVLTEAIMEYLHRIDKAVNDITVWWKNDTLRYRDICHKVGPGGCHLNEILSLSGKMKDFKRRKVRIKYPVDKTVTSKFRLSLINLGGVKTDDDGYVEDARAFRLVYVLRNSSDKNEVSKTWESKFLEVISSLRSDDANAYTFTGHTFDRETNRVTEISIPLIFIAGPLMLIFSILSCLTKDCVSSKPWVGVAGCLTPILGVIGAFSFLMICGAEYCDINIAIAFLLAGVGLDDSYVLLAAWRRSDPKKAVKERLAEAYSEAAVSVTITSLTNVLCFLVGLTTPYRIVQIFCLYAATSIFFCYVCQLMFFGSVLALSGFREKSGRHSILCIHLEQDKKRGTSFVGFFYNGGPSREDGANVHPNTVFGDKLGNALIKPSFKFIVYILFTLYLVAAIYSINYANDIIDLIDTFHYDSYARRSFQKYVEHFSEYPDPISIVINATLDYSDPQTQREVEDIIGAFIETPHMAGREMVDSWLDSYLASTRDPSFWLSYRGYNISDPIHFIESLRNLFLQIPPFRRYNHDIVFNENGTKIIATRYIVGSKDIVDSNTQRELLDKLWKIADSCKYQTYVHNYPLFLASSQIGVIRNTLQSIYTAVIAILVVLIVFVPDLGCATCVMFTVLSIEVGVIGYMSLWGVSFSHVSMIILLMSAGLSVDYVSHVAYSYLSCTHDDPNEKLKRALNCAGYPVVQGCLSTIMGVAVCAFAPYYPIVVFFKVITLVMVFSGGHALFVLPVTLNMFDKLWMKVKRKCGGN